MTIELDHVIVSARNQRASVGDAYRKLCAASDFILMQQPTPFFRELGAGPGVVCLHANASSSSQWRALTLRRVEVVEFEGLGHMGPVTHPEVVNEAISRFLERDN
jgi:pimeloyl-ACP methyl ester carboxylesterase